jgi:fructokinase
MYNLRCATKVPSSVSGTKFSGCLNWRTGPGAVELTKTGNSRRASGYAMNMTTKAVIVSCGEVLWDLFPEGPRFGGAPANFACHTAIEGGDVSMLSAVGEDPAGTEAIAILEAYGIDTSLIQRIADLPTGTVGVKLDSSAKPTYQIHSESAWDRIAWSPLLESRIVEADAIYFGTLGQRGERSRATIRRALDLAKSHGVLRVLDVNLHRSSMPN